MRKRETAGWKRAIEQGERWTEADAREALTECERSGESVVAFGRRNGIAPRRLYWWRYQLRKESRTPARERVARLIPVTVRAAEWAEGTGRNVTVVDGELRVEIGDASRVAPEWVAEVLRRVQEGRE